MPGVLGRLRIDQDNNFPKRGHSLKLHLTALRAQLAIEGCVPEDLAA